MRIRLNPIAFLALLAAVIAAFAFAIDHWRERPVLSDAQLVASLPSQGATTVFFANLAVLRVAALIKALAGIKPAEEKDYTAFVNQTQFDYTRDVDLLTGSAGNGRWFFLARGRFDWNKLSRYAEAHGGTCQGRMCSVPASEPGRWASFEQIQPALLALAVTPEKDAVRQWPGVKDRVSHLPSSEPAWVEISPDLLKNPAGWPAALRIFAIALQSADSVMISLGPARAQSGGSIRHTARRQVRKRSRRRSDAQATAVGDEDAAVGSIALARSAERGRFDGTSNSRIFPVKTGPCLCDLAGELGSH